GAGLPSALGRHGRNGRCAARAGGIDLSYSVDRHGTHGTHRRASNGRNGPSPVYAHGSASKAEGMSASELAIRAIPCEKLTAAGVATQLLTERHRQNLSGLAT